MTTLLEISNLSAKVGGKNVLRGVSLTVNAGEVHAIMCESVKGKRRSEITHLFNEVHEVLTKHDAPVPEDLGKLAALSGVREFPVRVKCASLCWHTLNAALERSHEPVKTE